MAFGTSYSCKPVAKLHVLQGMKTFNEQRPCILYKQKCDMEMKKNQYSSEQNYRCLYTNVSIKIITLINLCSLCCLFLHLYTQLIENY